MLTSVERGFSPADAPEFFLGVMVLRRRLCRLSACKVMRPVALLVVSLPLTERF